GFSSSRQCAGSAAMESIVDHPVAFRSAPAELTMARNSWSLGRGSRQSLGRQHARASLGRPGATLADSRGTALNTQRRQRRTHVMADKKGANEGLYPKEPPIEVGSLSA